MSAVANLKFFASLFGIRDLDTAGLLERVGLSDDRKDRVSNYSKGMKQRLMVARALNGDSFLACCPKIKLLLSHI